MRTILCGLEGDISIGHTRYSTTGASVLRNVQPIMCELPFATVALAHNGDLINASALREKMEGEGVEFETTNDTEVIAKLLIASGASTMVSDAHT